MPTAQRHSAPARPRYLLKLLVNPLCKLLPELLDSLEDLLSEGRQVLPVFRSLIG